MKKQWKRLLIAALISSSVFAATWFWYQSTASNYSSNSSEKPLAYVGKVVEDIQRRPSSRLLWQLVNTGEPLYNGEAIRTSEHGEVRIQFVDSDRYLDLEPESLIVIKKSEGEIALDLMEGSLFVNAKTESTDAKSPGLVLNSANGKVDLSQAAASLTKGTGSAIDVQVLEGKASIKGNDGQTKTLTEQQKVKILNPLPQKPVAMNAESLEPIKFQWEGFPTNTKVSLWTGPNRKELKSVKTSEPNARNLEMLLAFGRHYWKLVATTADGKVAAESAIFKTEIQARYAPTMVFPTVDAEIPAESSPFDLTFKWQKGDETKQVTLEVWGDQNLSKKISSKTFSTEEAFTLPGLQNGTYYWRMTSYFSDTKNPVIGKIEKFTIKTSAEVLAQKAPTPILVEFTMPEKEFTQYYTEEPKLGLSWHSDKPDNIASWRLKYHGEEEDPAQATSVDIKDTKISTPVTKPGRYLASIEALDIKGKVVGSANSQILTVAPLPLLNAPTFEPGEGSLQASMDGRIKLIWNKVDGAREYWLSIRKNGKELKRSKYMETSAALKNLLPGEYEVQILAVDSHGRNSETAESRTLVVPDKSNLRAPTLKNIKVN